MSQLGTVVGPVRLVELPTSESQRHLCAGSVRSCDSSHTHTHTHTHTQTQRHADPPAHPPVHPPAHPHRTCEKPITPSKGPCSLSTRWRYSQDVPQPCTWRWYCPASQLQGAGCQDSSHPGPHASSPPAVTHTRSHTHTHTGTNMLHPNAYVDMHTYSPPPANMHAHMCTHTHTHVQTYTHTLHTYAHTDAPPPTPPSALTHSPTHPPPLPHFRPPPSPNSQASPSSEACSHSQALLRPITRISQPAAGGRCEGGQPTAACLLLLLLLLL